MFRVLGSILFGGGMIGVLAGWMLVTWLDRRRAQMLALAAKSKQQFDSYVEQVRAPEPRPTNAPGAIINYSGGPTPPMIPMPTVDEVANDPQLTQWLMHQKEQKMRAAMAELYMRMEAEEQRRKGLP